MSNFNNELNKFLENELKIKKDSEEWKKAEYFIKNKGLYIHKWIYDYIKEKVPGNINIEYKHIATAYRYDKKIRNVFYKFISLIEEKMVSILSNSFDDDINKLKIEEKEGKESTREKIKEIIENKIEELKTTSIWKILENIDFFWIIHIFDQNKDHLEIHGILRDNCIENNYKKLKDAFHDIRNIRNNIYHNRLFFYSLQLLKKYNPKKNIFEPFQIILNDEEWKGFNKKINDCANNDDINKKNEDPLFSIQTDWDLIEEIKLKI